MPTEATRSTLILYAEDDADDQLLVKEALDEANLSNEIRFVNDGEELMDYLLRRGSYADRHASPRPGLILLDLNMPRKSGREALAEIKQNPDLRRIPIVVLTTSKAAQDVHRSYDLGVNSFIAKPISFAGMIDAMKALAAYWFQTVQLPPGEMAASD